VTTPTTRRLLLYSPDVVGHPRVYCRVIADALTNGSCELAVAVGLTDTVGLSESPDLQALVGRRRVELFETRAFSRHGNSHLTAEELVALQQHCAADTTLFIEADKSTKEFAQIAANRAPRLIGRNIGIFADACEWYPGEDRFTGERRSLLASTLRTTVGNIKRSVLDRTKTARHFFEKTIIQSKVLDEVWVKDERLSEWRGHPVYWMPEISRPACGDERADEIALLARRTGELQAFLAANVGHEPVLYFGDAAYYKGYDLFLQFIASTPSTCAIHAGQSYDSVQRGYFSCDVDALRKQLTDEGRLYETNEYVHTQGLKELYFNCVRVYLTTHRLALSSSTVIQALELGKPVLVPDRGLLGHRVQSNGIGDVYQYGDIADLRRKAEAMWHSDLSGRSAAARQFWTRFSDESIRSFFRVRLGIGTLATQTVQ
jgi:glycosyltransferase involved in cell wall biosynthesis